MSHPGPSFYMDDWQLSQRATKAAATRERNRAHLCERVADLEAMCVRLIAERDRLASLVRAIHAATGPLK